MNEHFVNVKVDSEERPDVDSLYMDAVLALTGSGGWPMTVFLTPDGEPFYGGTYFPPEPRHGLPSFRQVLASVARGLPRATRRRRAQAKALTDSIRSSARIEASREPLTESLLQQAVRGLRSGFDPRWGGWGRRAEVPAGLGDRVPPAHARRDRPGGERRWTAWPGWHVRPAGRRLPPLSVDARWLVPHFEKMLYDNALLVPAYLHGWLVTGNERYRQDRRGDGGRTCCASLRSGTAALRRRRTRTPRASRASPSRGRLGEGAP